MVMICSNCTGTIRLLANACNVPETKRHDTKVRLMIQDFESKFDAGIAAASTADETVDCHDSRN